MVEKELKEHHKYLEDKINDSTSNLISYILENKKVIRTLRKQLMKEGLKMGVLMVTLFVGVTKIYDSLNIDNDLAFGVAMIILSIIGYLKVLRG